MQSYQDYEPQFGIFRELIKFRVRDILLVSSFYDAFVLEEDGRLSDKIFSEYIDLNLRFIPRIVRVSSAEEAIVAITKGSFDLVITMTRISDMNPHEFGRKVKDLNPGMPVILLTYEWIDDTMLMSFRKTKFIDKVFYWAGDTKILLAIIKYIEDMRNVDNDIQQGVRVILIIEDSPRFYSKFLPLMYTEIMTQTRLLISEGVNDLHRLLRMRARPKILMAEDYEQGMEYYEKYKKNLLGILCDIKFPEAGVSNPEAGFLFSKMIKKELPDLPVLLQSSNIQNRRKAEQLGLHFLYKNSEKLLHDLHEFILSYFGFGDFVFKTPGGREIGRATNLLEFEKMIQLVPDESLEYHAQKNHISLWLRARTEFETADSLRPRKVSDFDGIKKLRTFIIQEIQKLIQKNQSGVITDFKQSQVDRQGTFIRLGGGSLGGKARGIAFINALLAQSDLASRFQEVDIQTPLTFVIGSEVFEEFILKNRLQEFAIEEDKNEVIARKFLKAQFPASISNDLGTLLLKVGYPIAVRSSSILEDSQTLPFAGLYSTYMLPNNHRDTSTRLQQLCDAIKLVYASVYYKSPKEYVRNTSFRIEDEKMAVIIQKIVGMPYGKLFYPVISGVAQSYNYYPISHLRPDDGVAQLAIGLGSIIVEGAQVYRFSPRFPEMNPPVSSPKDFIKKSQNYFYALNIGDTKLKISEDESFSLKRNDLVQAQQDGTLSFVGSTYSPQDNVIRDTLAVEGVRVVTFANILKHGLFPLADILNEILSIGRKSFGCHIEIEFAVNVFREKERRTEFDWLQVRPMVAGRESVDVSLENIRSEHQVCQSINAIGNGVFSELYDIVYVDPDEFNPAKTRLIAAEIGRINQRFIREGRHYILIGFGRWGTLDPWLGIPVEWHQISKAKLVIETNLRNFRIEPSQGSHFFHNMISQKMGYFFINWLAEEEFVDWDWFKTQKPLQALKFVKHLRFHDSMTVKINARISTGIVLKPGLK